MRGNHMANGFHSQRTSNSENISMTWWPLFISSLVGDQFPSQALFGDQFPIPQGGNALWECSPFNMKSPHPLILGHCTRLNFGPQHWNSRWEAMLSKSLGIQKPWVSCYQTCMWSLIIYLSRLGKLTGGATEPYGVSNTNLNSLRPSDTICHRRSRWTLVQVMACCLTAPSHYLNQCWLIVSVSCGIDMRAVS